MKFGVVLPQHDAGPDELLQAARSAEEAGLDSIWLSDHLWGYIGGPERPVLEGWTSLAAVAAATERITVGSLVTRVTLRLPRVLAAMAETVARVAPGRLVVGFGVSDRSNLAEQRAYGITFPPKGERRRLLRDHLAVMRGLLPQVPVWVGGTSEEVLRVAARADGWNFWGPADDFPLHRARLAEMVGDGRFPETSWAGSFPGEEGVDALARTGCDHLIVAVGAKNYPERIEGTAALMAKYPPRV